MKNPVYPVILAGGSGTRLWPRSREKYPKQFISLIDGKSLFQETCLRFTGPLFAPLTIVTHEEHRFLVRDQLKEIGIKDAVIITERMAKNTAAACLSAACYLKKIYGNIPTLFTPADHIVKNEENLFAAIKKALPFVQNGSIALFGITPSSPHTGYGYIHGTEVLSEGITGPSTIIEKPNKERAEELIKNGAFWNSGLYFLTPDTLKEEAKLYLEEMHASLEKYFNEIDQDGNGFVKIDKDTYAHIDPISIDKGIAEKTNKLIHAHAPIMWSDLGSWSSLYDHYDKDDRGNVAKGDTLIINTRNSYIDSDKRLVTVFGLDNVAVIETADAVTVFPLSESESIKKIVGTLANDKRQEVEVHTTVHRPWGKYTVLGDEPTFKSKQITVLPGAELSLQRHKHRAEHWVVIHGTATVTRNDEVFELQENESTFLPKGAIHRLQNKHDTPLVIVEIQTGDYFGEDDIERFKDVYGRS